MSKTHTPEPWFIRTDCVNENMKFIHSEKTGSPICSIVDRGRANTQRIVECVNACAGQSIEDVKLATAHKEVCMRWERMMMSLLGEDSHAQVTFSIEMLKNERAEFLAEVIKLKTDNKRLKEALGELAEMLIKIRANNEAEGGVWNSVESREITELLNKYIP